DTLLFGDAARAGGTAFPGRMAPATALNFVLLSAAITFVDRKHSDWLAIIPAALAIVAGAGYLFSLVTLGRLVSYTSISLLTVFGFVLLSTGVLCARPFQGLTRTLIASGPEGIMARRMYAAGVVIPIIAVWAGLSGIRSGLVSAEVGAGLLTATIIVLFIAVARTTAAGLEAAERGRRRAESQSHGSENRYRELFDHAPVGLYRASPDGELLDVNRSLERTLGYNSPGALGDHAALELLADEKERQDWLTLLQADGAVSGREFQARRSDGAIIWLQMNARVVRGKGGQTKYFQGCVVDVTDRRRLEEQLLQAQKMEAVGRLAGGVAHDFNNLLTVMIAGTQLARADLREEDPHIEDLEDVLDAARRGATLTSQLLAFSRQQVLEPVVLDLNRVVGQTESLLRRLIGADIELFTACGRDLHRVRADPSQMEQVILNLAVNSRDAMPEGGRLTIETANVELDADYAEDHAEVTPGPYVLLAVSDTGQGMTEETRRRIFDPFFTTKRPGEGTGLGLATVHGIVKQSGGHIWVYSEPGQGTTFKIYLPQVVRDRSEPRIPEDEDRVSTGHETILVAEDNEAVRRATRRMLEARGFTVLLARDAGEALQVLASHQGPIHLLLTDVVMPGQSGTQLADELERGGNPIPVLLTSGYADDAVTRHSITRAGAYFLQKPFTQ
ncbi:MAG: ATP-binding protein, partial [Gemmatimonadales bacterium]